MLSVFDDIEIKLDEWNKKEKKKEDIEDSNAIPPKKESISDKLDKLGRKMDKNQQRGDDHYNKNADSRNKQIQFEVPWKHSKKVINDFKKMLGF